MVTSKMTKEGLTAANQSYFARNKLENIPQCIRIQCKFVIWDILLSNSLQGHTSIFWPCADQDL